jgi:hypothetical protein
MDDIGHIVMRPYKIIDRASDESIIVYSPVILPPAITHQTEKQTAE